MSNERSEIVSMWVTPEVAKLIKEADDPDTKERILADAAKKIKGHMQTEVDEMDDELVRYKGMLANFKIEFKKAKKDQLKEMYDIWEDFDQEISKIQKKIDSITQVVEPLNKQASDLNNLLSKLNTYNLDKLLELLNAINRAYSGKSKEIINYLFKTYKNE